MPPPALFAEAAADIETDDDNDVSGSVKSSTASLERKRIWIGANDAAMSVVMVWYGSECPV